MKCLYLLSWRHFTRPITPPSKPCLGGTYAVTARAAGAGNVALIETNVGPGVVNLQGTGIHLKLTRLVLTFDRPMNAATAQDLRNYSLYPIGSHGYGGPYPKPIPIVTAEYNTATRSVTLTPQTRLTLSGYYPLTVSGVGPHPVRDVDGNPLTGTNTGGRPGDYIAVVHGFGPWRPAPSIVPAKAMALLAGARALAKPAAVLSPWGAPRSSSDVARTGGHTRPNVR